MNPSSPKRSAGSILLGLLLSTGYLMLTGAVPIGIVALLKERYDPMALMTLLIGGIGGLFLLLGKIIHKVQRQRSQAISK